jgi:hypothetical protein
MLLAFFLVGVWGVRVFKRGRSLRGATVTLVVAAFVFFAAAESFALVEADYCNCRVDRRHGAAEAVWLAFDAVPLLEINELLGWEEPQQLSDTGDTSESLAPAGRWFHAMLIQLTVVVVLVALVKEAYTTVDRWLGRARGKPPPVAP